MIFPLVPLTDPSLLVVAENVVTDRQTDRQTGRKFGNRLTDRETYERSTVALIAHVL